MKVMLLAAGRGERLRPLTDTTPKCMLRVAGRPLLEHWIEKLSTNGFRDIAVNLHSFPDQVTSYFGTGERWGVRLHYSLEEALLGTAGGVKKLESYFELEPFLVTYADNLSSCDLVEFRRFHEKHGGLASMAVCWLEDPSSCGIVEFDDRYRILRFLEKPSPLEVFSHYINAGIYAFEPEIFRYIPDGGCPDFSLHVFPRILEEGHSFYAYPYRGYVLKFDRTEDWNRSLVFLESQANHPPQRPDQGIVREL
ncbi:MAG: hypothetical protein A3G41_04230 [Elusimicrobia bacterium RIFCSPLOWO2_12_FULL_59_9]|nr:MAG: hypothetical protein A3G41_04230 [Elusimicrobia bacterium RIFCSPLOWO2_12_FULL_59_9]